MWPVSSVPLCSELTGLICGCQSFLTAAISKRPTKAHKSHQAIKPATSYLQLVHYKYLIHPPSPLHTHSTVYYFPSFRSCMCSLSLFHLSPVLFASAVLCTWDPNPLFFFASAQPVIPPPFHLFIPLSAAAVTLLQRPAISVRINYQIPHGWTSHSHKATENQRKEWVVVRRKKV